MELAYIFFTIDTAMFAISISLQVVSLYYARKLVDANDHRAG